MANLVQDIVHPTPQSDHPNSVVEVDEPIFDSPMFTLANISAEFLKACALEPTSPSTQGMIPEEEVLAIKLEISSKELSPPQYSKFPAEPFTLNQQIID